jgi:hypothetical protein
MIRSLSITALAATALIAAACSDDSDDGGGMGGSAGTAGMAGSAGSAGMAGSAGSAGMAGSAGSGGMAGSAGSSAMAGSGGSAGSTGMAGSAGSTGMTGSAPDATMSFFVTSEGSGEDGGDLGGLDGADATCQALAAAVGAGDKTWHAYLSTDTVDARDRIGTGPWFNHGGAMIASDVADLHDPATVFNGDPNLILDENGVNAPGPEHDILTGTTADGTAAAGLNCDNWTSNSEALTENPQVGHSDIPVGFSPLWHEAHASLNCSEAGLSMRGGAGRLYCFAE